MPLWWYYWARLSQIEISRCNSVTNSDVSHTYYKCKLRPNENAHIKCFEPNTHIHMHSFKLTPNAAHKICRVSDSTIFDLTFKIGSINQYFVWNIYDVQKWTAFVEWFKRYNILIKVSLLKHIMIEDIVVIMLQLYASSINGQISD